ncbi:MAG: 4-phosphoerythronate dehydrogenase, partial [Verrucomicrobiota bacterium]|nr:4-phosphoerythronate dehydrogenase [Verrucomicrobiota bacterium]
MNIVCAESVYKGKEIFSEFGHCKILPDKKITKHDLKKTDALIIRSGTKVNHELLENTPVKFVGTTTSGIDHVDTSFLRKANIRFVDAAGSNAESVANYVISAILSIAVEKKINIRGKKIAIIGNGNVAHRLIPKLKCLGLIVLINDPPKAFSKKSYFPDEKLESLKKILPQADIVSIHTPFTTTGKWPTKKLVNDKFLKLMKKDSIFINTSRGGVCDEEALILAKKNDEIGMIVTDVWNNEPDYNKELCNHSIIATPHIAGHSLRAKFEGTIACAGHLSKNFKINFDKYYDLIHEKNFKYLKKIQINLKNFSSELEALEYIMRLAYDIKEDSNIMKNNQNLEALEKCKFFSDLR